MVLLMCAAKNDAVQQDPEQKDSNQKDSTLGGRHLIRELFGLFLLFWGLLLFLSLITYNQYDPSLNHVVSTPVPVHNQAGLFGAYIGGLLVEIFGIASFVCPLIFIAWGAGCVASWFTMPWWRWLGFFILGACLISLGTAWDFGIGDVRGGGMLGVTLYSFGHMYLSPTGSTLAWLFLLFLAIELAFGISWLGILHSAVNAIQAKCIEHAIDWSSLPKYLATMKMPHISLPRFERVSSRLPQDTDTTIEVIPLYEIHDGRDEQALPLHASTDSEAAVTDDEHDATSDDTKTEKPAGKHGKASVMDPRAASSEPASNSVPAGAPPLPRVRKIALPTISLLHAVRGNDVKQSPEVSNARGVLLMECLNNFNIQGTLVRYTSGPVVTLFEVRPAPGVKVGRISTLDKELAMALKAVAVRIQAPVPGSDTIGFEIPNDARAMVGFRELLESKAFSESSSLLTLAIGKDVGGLPVAADLARMPHLLVAGATGAGKSVCLNAFLLSLLYKATPDDVKLLLIDPKRVELAVYADLPHLVHPVVTEALLAKTALEWAVYEMDRRYQCISRLSHLGVRNYTEYHQRLLTMGKNRPQEFADLEPFPYLVIVIDELADLMYTAGKDVQTSIVRLAQLARAAGMHLIVATQRPSVDVVTGLIKANFPCRISFQVTSKHDSSTILDMGGAERLLGKGDMLYKPSGSKPQRLHGAYVSDEDVMAVVDYWKSHGKPSYVINFEEWGAVPDEPKFTERNPLSAKDEALYLEAVAFSKECDRALSISLLQRQFSIGFNKAARFMDRMEAEGVIHPADRPGRARQLPLKAPE